MDMTDFFYSANKPSSYMVLSESGRAYYNRRPRVVELLVPMCCNKCEEKIQEIMLDIEGVTGVTVNPITQRVTVSGYVDALRILKRARKVDKHSQLLLLPEASSPRKHHHRSGYWPSSYEISCSLKHRPPVHPTSYNCYKPAHAGHDVHAPRFEGSDSRVITNPCYVKYFEPNYLH
jgi:copper chaperone CopZ